VRVAVLGGVAFALFAIVLLRLWFLRVLSRDDYVSQARENRVRKLRIRRRTATSSTATARCWSSRRASSGASAGADQTQ
jgi:cell division protein FtsI/penicillin-binding protein 2